jgi:PBP1b-binding outer membrane lipoprotein LpoB
VRRLVLALAILVAGCDGAATTPAAPSSTPAATEEPTRSDAEIAAVLIDTVDEVYCGEAPKPAWCKAIAKVGKSYAIEVDRTTVFVASKLPNNTAGKKLAMSMCRDLAATHFDENGIDLGVAHFHVFDGTGGEIIADCNIPGY